MVLLQRQIRVTWLLYSGVMGRRSFGNIRKFRSGHYQARYFYRGTWYKVLPARLDDNGSATFAVHRPA